MLVSLYTYVLEFVLFVLVVVIGIVDVEVRYVVELFWVTVVLLFVEHALAAETGIQID